MCELTPAMKHGEANSKDKTILEDFFLFVSALHLLGALHLLSWSASHSLNVQCRNPSWEYVIGLDLLDEFLSSGLLFSYNDLFPSGVFYEARNSREQPGEDWPPHCPHWRECRLKLAPIFVLVDKKLSVTWTNMILLKPNLESKF
jgi:hypothetical protein